MYYRSAHAAVVVYDITSAVRPHLLIRCLLDCGKFSALTSPHPSTDIVCSPRL